MEAGYRELKRFERRSQDGAANGTTWGRISPRKGRNATEALERGLRGAKGNGGEENIISAVIHDETTPHLIVILKAKLTAGNLSAKDRRQRKCADAREIS